MTITAIDSRNEYTASAAQVVFNYTFRIYSALDLNVYITPAGQECTDADLTTDYTVDTATINDPDGGFITLNVGSTAGDLVTINSAITQDRTTDYQSNGDFIPSTVNADFDRIVSLVKQLETNIKRAPQFLECSQGTTAITMEPPEALQYPRWKADLTGFENVDLAAFGLPTTSDLISFLPAGTGAVLSTIQAKLRLARDVEDFGAVGDGALSGAAPVGTGTGTDDSAAIILALNWVRDTGGALRFDGTKVYLCDSPLTLLRNSSTGPAQYVIEFNGASFDCSNQATGDYFTIGADSLANIATDGGLNYIGRGFFYGQQAGNPGLVATTSTNTATTGIATQWCYNLVMNQMNAPRCYRGLKTFYTFPILDLQSSFKRCIAGISFNDVTNRGTWIGTEAPLCRFGLVTELDGTADSGKCVNHTFIGFRPEGSAVSGHIDPGSNNAGIAVLKGWKFIDPYISGNTHDNFRMGTVLDLEDATARGADSTDRIYNFKFDAHSAFWGITPSATNSAFVFSTNNNVRQCVFEIPVDISVANTITNTPRNSDILCVAQPDATSDIPPTKYRYDSSGVLYDTDSSETVLVTGTISPAGITYLDGSSGVYTVTLADGTVDGQTKRITMSESSNAVTVSVTSHESGDPTLFVFNNVQDLLGLEWFNQDWHTVLTRGI